MVLAFDLSATHSCICYSGLFAYKLFAVMVGLEEEAVVAGLEENTVMVGLEEDVD